MVMPGTVSGPVIATAGIIVTTSDDDFKLTNPTAPIAQQGSKLIADDATYEANQGAAVALSADGKTAVIGGSYDNNRIGATWIYKLVGGTWVKISKLIGTGATGSSYQGSAVAISADGGTILTKGTTDNEHTGVAWCFVRQTDSTWTQQGAMIPSPGGTGTSIFSMALSADGNTAVFGAYGNSTTDVAKGGAWIVTRNGNTWLKQGRTLIGTDAVGNAYQGISVAISSDGNTVISGGYTDNGGIGAGWVFVRNGNVWTQQGSKLTGTGNIGNSFMGRCVALSADGNTAVLGGYYDNNGKGAAWVFTRNGNTFTQYGDKLPGIGTNPQYLGTTIAISADGKTFVTGGPQAYAESGKDKGATWVFKLVNNVWTQQGDKLIGTGSVQGAGDFVFQGISVAISADGTEMLTGGSADAAYKGATWAFTTAPNPPVITSLNPASGPVGTLITVNGSNFGDGVKLAIGGKPALITSTSASSITAMVMPGTTTGSVTLSSGNDTGTAADVFTVTNPGPPITQQGAKIDAATTNYAEQGYALSLNANGTKAVMGAPFDGNYSGNTYGFSIEVGGAITTERLPRPTATVKYVGRTVAISADGNTAVTYGLINSTYVIQFYSHQTGTWMVDGPTIYPPAGNGYSLYMYSAALSADGKTAVINGSKGYSQSALYVYVKSRGAWLLKIDLLSDVNPSLAGKSIGCSTISADGNTIMAGASDGGVLVFHRADNGWTQQGNELMGAESIGSSLALSADGNSAIIKGSTGFYNYIRTGNTWAQYGSKITGTYQLYNTLGLTADGKTFVTSGADGGEYGATYVFRMVNGVWTQQASLVGTGISEKGDGDIDPRQGTSVAISANGTEMLTGSNGDGGGRGATWAFYSAPEQQMQSISFKQPMALTANSTGDDIFAAASSGLPVEFTSNNPNVAKVVNGQVKIVGRGPVTITARQNGNKEFKAAEPVSRALTITRDLIPNSLNLTDGPVVDPALSPNGDGKNDVLTITNIEMYPDNKLVVINTNGDKVFEATGYDNKGKAFNGRSTIDSKQQKPGTYYYRLEYKDNGVVKNKTGYIVIKY